MHRDSHRAERGNRNRTLLFRGNTLSSPSSHRFRFCVLCLVYRHCQTDAMPGPSMLARQVSLAGAGLGFGG